MFEKLFGRKARLSEEPSDPKQAELIRAIREQRKEDPLVGAKIASKEILERLLAALRDERGVHTESLLCALGSLAGYSCQANLRAQAVAKGMPETAAFQVVTVTDGRKYFYGDPLNNALAGSQYSVWALAGGAAQHAGATELPDLNDIFAHTASVLGSAQFGVPRVPPQYSPREKPAYYLKNLWPVVFPVVDQLCPVPTEWAIAFGLATQHAIDMTKEALPPSIALSIIMESAVPMSKVDMAAI